MSPDLPAGIRGGYLGKGVIVYSGKPSTRTRLHEIAHRRLGHEPGKMTAGEFAREEIEAEEWAWRAMDKKFTYRVGYPAYASLIQEYGYSPSDALGIVYFELRKKGIEVSEIGVSWFMSRRISGGSS